MEIVWPTNVRHVAHVTFDHFNGFLGLPVEFEPEVPRRAPSASATIFGVSTESMQLSYDSRGNFVLAILLLMQNCLYGQGGLHAEGIFRLNAENSEEGYQFVQMDDPLTTLMYAVKVMNFVKTLIEKVLRDRQDSVVEQAHVFPLEPSDESGNQSPSLSLAFNTIEQSEETLSDYIKNTENQSSSSEISDELISESNASKWRESDCGKYRTSRLSDSDLQVLTLAPPA